MSAQRSATTVTPTVHHLAMNRFAPAVVAVSLMVLAGCGDDPSGTATTARTCPEPASGPDAPQKPGSAVIISRHFSARTDCFRAGNRSFRGCGTIIDNEESGYDLRDVAVSGPVSCTTGNSVISSLSEQVQRGQASGEDCFPGYCTADDPRPTSVAGYRCTATDDPELDVISRSVVCRRGERYVSARAEDDA